MHNISLNSYGQFRKIYLRFAEDKFYFAFENRNHQQKLWPKLYFEKIYFNFIKSLYNKIINIYIMENPQALPSKLIYQYDNKTNQTWNMKEYKVPKEYLDPLLQVKKRQWAVQKKGQPNKNYVTKKGFYMDYPLKVASSVPSASLHGKNQPWSFQKEAIISNHRKMDSKLIKQTYIERIEIEQKNRKVPGIGFYKIQKSQKEKDADVQSLREKKRSVGDKRFYYEETENISGRIPGPGAYNPHDKVVKLRKNKTIYGEWIKKHKSESEKKQKRSASIPAPGTYHPMNCTFTTFDTINKSPKKKGDIDYFGKDARFTYVRPDKKKIKQERPSPNSYKTLFEWKGKGSPKKKQWNQMVSKGFSTISIYH